MLSQIHHVYPEKIREGRAVNFCKNQIKFKTKHLNETRRELEVMIGHMQRLLMVDKEDFDLPVAFATNLLYVLAKNGLAHTEQSQKVIREICVPLINKKQEWLHSEGVSMAVYGLTEAGVFEEKTWQLLQAKVRDKDMDYRIVKNDYWDPTQFTTMNGDEHLAEKPFDEFGKTLFFEDRINLYELYEAIDRAKEKCPELPGLAETKVFLEERYTEILENQDKYQALTSFEKPKIEPQLIDSQEDLFKALKEKADEQE